jgi:hypothetical protein
MAAHQTEMKAPVDGWVTNLSTRVGDYATTGHPVFALVDSHSFYVVGYFEETKLRHIRPAIARRSFLQQQANVTGSRIQHRPRHRRPERGERRRPGGEHQTEYPVGPSGPARTGAH